MLTFFKVCGPSGSGKTTVVNLIERFYEVTSGSLTIDNIDIKNFDLKYLHSKIGYVAQEPSLFSGTIEENITYGINKYTHDELI